MSEGSDDVNAISLSQITGAILRSSLATAAVLTRWCPKIKRQELGCQHLPLQASSSNSRGKKGDLFLEQIKNIYRLAHFIQNNPINTLPGLTTWAVRHTSHMSRLLVRIFWEINHPIYLIQSRQQNHRHNYYASQYIWGPVQKNKVRHVGHAMITWPVT